MVSAEWMENLFIYNNCIINHLFFRVGSLATFGAAGALGGLYFTDWKLILQFVPFYSGKFVKDEE